MKVIDLTENEQTVKYIIMKGGYSDLELHDIFRFDNLKYGLFTRSLLKCIAFEFKHSEWYILWSNECLGTC